MTLIVAIPSATARRDSSLPSKGTLSSSNIAETRLHV